MKLIFPIAPIITLFILFTISCKPLTHNPMPTDSKNCITFIYHTGINDDWHFKVKCNDVLNHPDWTPYERPLHRLNKIARIAESVLPQYLYDFKDWRLNSVQIYNISCDCNSTKTDKWIYLVHFQRGFSPGIFAIPITLDGKPIRGILKHDNDPAR